jgi:predicted CXXCH cytochrome family protein
MRKVLFLSVLALATSLLAAVPSQMVNTGHDLSTGSTGTTFDATNVNEICVFCHTPHQAAAANAQDPLWNHTLSSTASYGAYSSVTMNANPTAFGGGAAAVGTANVSQLCMSCHDGTIGVGSLYNPPNVATPDNNATTITGSALVGTSLADDHPVNFTYNAALATADGGLETPVSANYVDAGSTVPLFGATVQCASCHDPHDDTYTPFLVTTNADSALCVTCHAK